MAEPAKENSKESLEQISEMLHNILVGIEKGTHREKYLDYEIYGCLEKTSEKYIKVRVSDKAYTKYQDDFNNLKKYYKTEENLDHIPGKLKKKLHAEHIYPRIMLKKDLIEKKPNYDVNEILEILQEKAKGILITKEEAAELDKICKITMPDDWKVVEDRLKQAQIEIHKENGKDVYYTIAGF